MPIYEYECEKCSAVFEVMQPISARPLKKCQGMGCNNKDDGKVHRLISSSGFILKGSGWYATDYPSETRKQGWDSETKQANPVAPAGSEPAPKKDSSPAPADQKTTQPKPIEKKSAPKNPYSGRRGEKAKTGK